MSDKKIEQHTPITKKAMTLTDAHLRGMADALGVSHAELKHPIFHNYISGKHQIVPAGPSGTLHDMIDAPKPLTLQPPTVPQQPAQSKMMEAVCRILERRDSQHPFTDAQINKGLGDVVKNYDKQRPFTDDQINKGLGDVVKKYDAQQAKSKPAPATVKANDSIAASPTPSPVAAAAKNYAQDQFRSNVDAMKADKPFPYDGSKDNKNSNDNNGPKNYARDQFQSNVDAMKSGKAFPYNEELTVKNTDPGMSVKPPSNFTNPDPGMSVNPFKPKFEGGKKNKIKEALVDMKQTPQKPPRSKNELPGAKSPEGVPTRDLTDSLIVKAVAILSEKKY